MDRDTTVRRIYLLRAQKASIEAEVARLVESLGDLPLGKAVAGDLIMDVQETRRFDAATAKKNLTPEQFESILKPTPNSALAKALLGDDYSRAQKVYGTQVRVYRPDDEEQEDE